MNLLKASQTFWTKPETYFSLLYLSAISNSPCTKINPLEVKKDCTKSAERLGGGPKYMNCAKKEKCNTKLANIQITRCECYIHM